MYASSEREKREEKEWVRVARVCMCVCFKFQNYLKEQGKKKARLLAQYSKLIAGT